MERRRHTDGAYPDLRGHGYAVTTVTAGARVPLAYARALAVGEKLKFYVGGNHATRTAARELLSLEIPLAVDMGPRLAAATTLVDGAHAESHSQFDSRCGGDRLAISRPPPGMVVTPFLWRSGVPN